MRPHQIPYASRLIVASMLDGATLEEGQVLVSRMVGAGHGEHEWPTLITERGRSLLPWQVTGRTWQAACQFKAVLAAK